MNRKYKIILGAACVTLSIFLGYLRLTAGADEEVFTSGPAGSERTANSSTGAPNDERLTAGEVAAEAGDPTQDSERTTAGSTGAKMAKNTDPAGVADAAAEKPPEEIVVHVCGCVNSPGVYRLEPGSRIIEAVEKAGGFTDDADNSVINLADRLTDGMQIYVPAIDPEADETDASRQYVKLADNIPERGTGSQAAGAAAGVEKSAATGANTGAEKGAGTSRESGKVNINTAGKEELMTLSGVGETRADAIIAYRTENGRFASIEEIMNISGIKEGLFGKIKDKITVD